MVGAVAGVIVLYVDCWYLIGVRGKAQRRMHVVAALPVVVLLLVQLWLIFHT